MAGKGVLGKLSVKVVPDLDGFAQKLKQDLRRIKQQVGDLDIVIDVGLDVDKRDLERLKRKISAIKPKINVDARVSKQSLNRIRRDLSKIGAKAKVSAELDQRSWAAAKKRLDDLDATVEIKSAFDEIELRRVRERLRKLNADIQVLPKVDRVALDRIRRVLDDMQFDASVTPEIAAKELLRIKRLLSGIEAEAKVRVDLDRESKEKAEHEIEDMDGEATVNVDLDAGKARAQLKALTRDRFVTLHARVSKSSIGQVARDLSNLAGIRALKTWGTDLRDLVSNLDRTALKMGYMASAVSTLGASLTAGVGSVIAFAAGLGKMTPALYAAPGLMLGMATAAGTLYAALKDFKAVLPDIVTRLSSLQQTISGSFWEQAATPIRELANVLFPVLEQRLTGVAAAQGKWAAAMANVTTGKIGEIDGLLANVEEAAGRATRGFSGITSGIITMGTVGSKYLPALADQFSRVGENFAAWADRASKDGSMEAAINRAVEAAKQLWAVTKNIGSAMGAVGKASAAAGYTLENLVEATRGLADILNSFEGQQTLTNLFAGAHDAMEAFRSRFTGLGDEFVSVSATIRQAARFAGEAVGNLGATIIKALSVKEANAGVIKFFQGIRDASRSLVEVAPELGSFFGGLAELAGSVARSLGGTLATAIKQLGPVLGDLFRALAPVVESMGTQLASAIVTLTPAITKIIEVFTNIIVKLDDMGILLPGIVTAFLSLKAISGITSIVTGLANAFTLVQGAVSVLGTGGSLAAVGSALLPIIGAVAGIAALAAGFYLLYQNSETFREVVGAIAESFQGAWATIVEWWNAEAVPALTGLWSAMQEAWDTFGAPLIETISAIFSGLKEHLGQIMSGIGQVFSGAWEYISSVFSGAIEIITGIIKVFTGVFSGDWSTLWEGVKSIASGAWNILTGLVSGFLSVIQGLWNTGWGLVKGVFQGFVNAIVNATANMGARVGSAFRSLISTIKNVFSNPLGLLRDVGAKIIDGLLNGLKSGYGKIKDSLGGLTRKITSWKGPEPVDRVLLRPAGRMIIGGLVDGFEDEFPAVKRSLNGLTNAISPEVQAKVNTDSSGAPGAPGGGPTINITQNYPVQETEDEIRNKVASGIRLAASL